MNKTILDDIINYIEFLRNQGFLVTVSCFDERFRSCFSVLFQYEVHLSSICSYLKTNDATRGRCAENKKKLNFKSPDNPYYSCCYAGVEEFVIPIKYEKKTIVCINVSGYCGKLKESKYLKTKIASKCNNNFEVLYNELICEVPTMEEINKFVKPLEYMFIELYNKCLNENEVYSQSEYIFNMILTYIFENYMNSISCSDISIALNYSESYLRHIFLKQSGMSITSYIKKIRLSKAEELLISTSLSITRIASDTGFCDANYFSTIFKRHYGFSPKHFRKYRN